MGGAIALRTAARHRVAGVAVVNPGLSFYDRRVRIIGLLKYFQRTTMPIQEENPTAATTDDGDYSLTPLAAVHQLRRLFAATLRGPAAGHRPGPGFQVGHRRRGAAVVPGAAAQAARVPGPHGGSPPAQRPRCHPGRRCAARSFEESVAVLPAARRTPFAAPRPLGDPMSILPDHTPFSSPFTGTAPGPASWSRTASPAARTVCGPGLSLAGAGFAVRLPLLPGHGTSWQELARTRWQDWHAALDAAYLELAAECDTWSWPGCPWAAPWRCGSRPPGPWPGWWWSTPAWSSMIPAPRWPAS